MDAPAGFPDTLQKSVWRLVAAAREGASTAMNSLLSLYRNPIYWHLRAKGLGPAEADDLTQETLMQLARGSAIGGADPSRGRFRNLVRAVAENVRRGDFRKEKALKRGGGRTVLSLDRLASPPAEPPDSEFEAGWALNLVFQGMYRLLDGADESQRRCVDAVYHHAVKGLGYDEVAGQIKETPANVKNLIHRGRRMLAEELLKLIAGYSKSEAEFEDEVAHVKRFLPPGVSLDFKDGSWEK